MANPQPTIVWFRDDLRLADNPALTDAIERGAPIALLYVLDETSTGLRPLGAASRWWLHHSLVALGAALKRSGQRLILRRGRARDVVLDLADELGAGAVVWNRRYSQPERDIDADIKTDLRARGVAAESFHANLLFEPWTIRSGSDQPFRVFTPFWRSCLGRMEPRLPLPAPKRWPGSATVISSEMLVDWRLLPSHPDWSEGLRAEWTPGEAGAASRLDAFLKQRLALYAGHRDEPAIEATSRLSPHLRFGEISPFQIWHALNGGDERDRGGPDRTKFLSELGWREFSWHLLYHRPDLASANFQPRFDSFPWSQPEPALLAAWQRGRTGYPIVDAGMRQLWQTGWMHNRVRMITASFLIKNLLADWRLGEAWFWDTLVDADAANNPAGWQWVAGSGADAAPYFRIFNPVLQGEKFDPEGAYIRRFVPELAGLPAKQIHKPWTSAKRLDYPPPLVDLSASRERALRAFASTQDAG
ncbi:deoxyribodipyrimidine photo-lyase [Kaistia dalseonensis]|uniref:Deoxyribodipyrimidine photo-lyase n=1 Tax=Kaistia dalseonensis TaxID=410840 RepID=A0ABU0H1P7_9HYPH|nr:deoxyribodipyrimidine photo-lyase [Kaistia dalseonensis]MCX5493672.1 deoxyribodipyrimidine photo-lyase [Kaistia dalseonensis]MDQ0436234.1 deoxyribodipyrimidine photo-lyase [Kaistia dalseonensis]